MARTIDPQDVRARLDDVIAALKGEDLWDVPRPDPAAFADMGAFGERSMAFEQWVRWVFVPSVEQRLVTAGPWPPTSSVAVRATREGDGNPAVAALVAPLGAFDALFGGPPSLRGLPAMTGRRAEEALAARADAKVAEGREDEAVAEMTAATVTPLAATAHNWLAWFFAQQRSEPQRAAEHGLQAIELRPRWGVAQLNLAWAREGCGQWVDAYRGYLEALACGDSHDEAFAEERVASLAAEAAARGEALPAPLEGSLTHARVEGVETVMRAVLAQVAASSERPDRSWFGAVGVPVPEGEVPFGWIGTRSDGRAFVHALVHDHGRFAVVEVLARGPRGLTLRGHTARGDVRDAARAVAERAADPASEDPAAVTPLDAAVLVRTALFEELPGRRFRLGGGGEHHAPDRVAATSVVPRRHAAQLAVSFEARAAGGVLLRAMTEGMGAAPPAPIEVPTYGALMEALPGLVESSRRALAALDAFRARPFSIETAARGVVRALHDAMAGEGEWEATVVDDGFPRRWPHAVVRLRRDGTERPAGRIDESSEGCRVELEGMGWLVRSPEELAASLPGIAGRVKYLLGKAAG